MKRKALCFLFLMLLIGNFSVSAYEVTDWINVGGSNCTVTQKDKTVAVEGKGYYPNANTGVVYGKEIDVSNVSIEFKIDKICGKENDGHDSWISLGLFTKKAYMDTSNTSKTAGIVLLIRPNNTGGARVQYYSLLEGESFASKKGDGLVKSFDEGNTYKLEFKADTTSGYALYINNEKITYQGNAADLNYLKGIYSNNKGYLALSMSDNKNTEMKLTITKLNGKTAIGGEETSETLFPSSSSSASSQQSSSSNNTSSKATSSESSVTSEQSSSSTSELESSSQSGVSFDTESSSVPKTNEENSKEKSNPTGLIMAIVVIVVIAGGLAYYFLIKPRMGLKK